ncbi:MAG TPA: hypothetical protein VF747_14915 [Blastocatellia bacterium]|jgi:hypothetical protein
MEFFERAAQLVYQAQYIGRYYPLSSDANFKTIDDERRIVSGFPASNASVSVEKSGEDLISNP